MLYLRMSVLASREHTCIHPLIRKSKSKNEECRDLLRVREKSDK